MNHVSVSPTDGNGPTQGQRKTLTRVGIEPRIAVAFPSCKLLTKQIENARHGHLKKKQKRNDLPIWNEKKCSVAHVKRGALSSDQGDTVVGDAQVIKALKEGESYKFPGVLENAKQEDELVLCGTSKVNLQGYLLSGQVPCRIITI